MNFEPVIMRFLSPSLLQGVSCVDLGTLQSAAYTGAVTQGD
jgi:hypothetical protein